jgi:ribosomal protein S18 acetylase RimI-like enzyme
MKILHATVTDLARVAPLWRALYEHQRQHGMRLVVPDSGFDSWSRAVAPLLGRFATIVFAEDEDGALAGFVSCRMQTLTPQFGSVIAGHIGEVYVRDDRRGVGVGRSMLVEALGWFRARDITRVSLQVLAGNPEAKEFYFRMGWHEELVQMVWEEDGGNGPA